MLVANDGLTETTVDDGFREDGEYRQEFQQPEVVGTQPPCQNHRYDEIEQAGPNRSDRRPCHAFDRLCSDTHLYDSKM